MPAKQPRLDYLGRPRHIVLDMHIPDFDPDLLHRFDPAHLVDACARAGADAVMFWTNSMTGLGHWPTATGATHPGPGGRDAVAELLRAEFADLERRLTT